MALLKFSRYPDEAKKLKGFILSDEGKAIFRSHAYCIDSSRVDEDMKWLVEACRAAKDPALPVTETTVGPFVNEVQRQRETRK